MVEGEKDVVSYDDQFAASILHDDVDDSKFKIDPESSKEHPKVIIDVDDNNEEKKDEKEGDVMGSLEIRTEKMQTQILTTPRSPRINLSSDKNIAQQVNQVLHLGVSQLAKQATEELIENNLNPCIAVTIIEDHDSFRSEVPDLVSYKFNAQASKIIEGLFKNYVQRNVIQVHPTTTTSTKTTSSADLQQ
nr:hypothetical protein [Tanacetum cinerariifolium]